MLSLLLLCVSYWHVDSQGWIVRVGNCLKSEALCNNVLSSVCQGLFSLLRDRKTALEAAGEEVTPTLLLAPIQIARWLQFYDNQVEPVQGLLRLVLALTPFQPACWHLHLASALYRQYACLCGCLCVFVCVCG